MSETWSKAEYKEWLAKNGGQIVPILGSKYRNKKTEVDGQVFDSKREAHRFQDLKIMEAHGLISDLRRQVKFPLVVHNVHIGTYKADFVYLEEGQTVVEDSKGFRTRDYIMKRKLMLACHGIAIRET